MKIIISRRVFNIIFKKMITMMIVKITIEINIMVVRLLLPT